MRGVPDAIPSEGRRRISRNSEEDGDVVMVAFCCARCYLEAMQVKFMWRA